MEAGVDIVGLGLGAGQATLAGHRALSHCRWLGHYGLPLEVRRDFLRQWPDALDLDAWLDAGSADGFVARLGEAVRGAALRWGRVGLAVAGHPVPANPATAWLRVHLEGHGIALAIHAAPSALDHFMAATGIDLVAHQVSLVDARNWLAQADDRAGRALAIWNVAYLADALRASLIERLCQRFDPGHPVTLFRIVGAEPRIEQFPLQPAAVWLSRVDAETTLFAF